MNLALTVYDCSIAVNGRYLDDDVNSFIIQVNKISYAYCQPITKRLNENEEVDGDDSVLWVTYVALDDGTRLEFGYRERKESVGDPLFEPYPMRDIRQAINEPVGICYRIGDGTGERYFDESVPTIDVNIVSDND